MKYIMTYDEFEFLKSKATENKQIEGITEENNTEGVLCTHDVDLGYHYDGAALNYTIVKKHTLASRLASDLYIETHIDEMIKDVLATKPEVTENK